MIFDGKKIMTNETELLEVFNNNRINIVIIILILIIILKIKGLL